MIRDGAAMLGRIVFTWFEVLAFTGSLILLFSVINYGIYILGNKFGLQCEDMAAHGGRAQRRRLLP